MANIGPFSWYCRDNAPTSTVGWSAVAPWATLTAVAAGVLRRQLATPTVGNERVFVCIIAGTTLVGEPSWTLTKGAKTAEAAGPTWQECTGQPGTNGDDAASNSVNTSAATASGAVLTFSAVPAGVAVGQLVVDKTTTTVIPAGTTVLSFTSTTVTMSASVTGGGVGSGDTIGFTFCPTWQMQKNIAVSLGHVIQSGIGTRLFICTTAGTPGNGAEPTWDTTVGNTTTDNTAVWTCIQATGSYADWAAPFARLASVFGTGWAAAGDTVYVGSDHAETQATSMTVTCTGTAALPNKILCINGAAALPAASASLAVTASVATTGATQIILTQTFALFYGISFKTASGGVGSDMFIGIGGAAFMTFVLCSLELRGTSGGGIVCGVNSSGLSQILFRNTTVRFASVSSYININGGRFLWENTVSAVLGSVPINLFGNIGNNALVVVRGVDLSALTVGKTIFGETTRPHDCYLLDCKLGASVTIAGSITGLGLPSVQVVTTDSAGTNYQNQKYDYQGVLIPETVVIRTGGASTGVTALSQRITTTANVSWTAPFISIPVAIRNAVTASNRVVTLYGVWNASAVPLNDDIWIEPEYFGSAASPQGSFATSGKASLLASGVALAADTSAWDTLVTARANTTAYSVGDIRKVATNPGRIFFCTSAGTSAGSEPAGYASAVDGGSVTDNTAVFRAACRFSLTVTLSAPQPAMAGPIYVTVNVAKASSVFYVDPLINLS